VLLSMTGFGDGRGEGSGFTVGVEIRSVNNRHLKLNVRGTEPYPLLESEFEKVIRKTVRRGTVLVHIRVDRSPRPGETRLNEAVLASYLEQLRNACERSGTLALLPALATNVLTLPGVAPEPSLTGGVPDDEWPVVERVLTDAIIRLNEARAAEGQTIAVEFLGHHKQLVGWLDTVRGLMPGVVENYRQRLLDRIRIAVAQAGASLEPQNLIREVALYADRTDVAEEVSRLTGHFESFAELVKAGAEGAGRRLEFVIQEMGREVNTLGSKAGDVAISRLVVEMKSTLEKIREQVQNIE